MLRSFLGKLENNSSEQLASPECRISNTDNHPTFSLSLCQNASMYTNMQLKVIDFLKHGFVYCFCAKGIQHYLTRCYILDHYI